jgi:nickel/cobalt transporter (NiCoT) family protein
MEPPSFTTSSYDYYGAVSGPGSRGKRVSPFHGEASFANLALGMRHGTDPDHLAVIDGLTRIRPRATNGVFFALGHGLVVILLAVGTGHVLAGRFAFLGPWSLILIGAVNLWRLLRNSKQFPAPKRLVIAQPFLLGMLLAAGFETASQLSALILAGQNNAFLVGVAFSSGMVLVDGLDGYLAALTQLLAAFGEARAKSASRVLGVIVVIFAFSLGGAELFGMELTRIALPLGLSLFIVVLAIRIWARSNGQAAEPEVIHTEPSRLTPRGNPAALTKE